VRRFLAALSSVALAVTGAQIAHELAYRLAEPSEHERAHLLADTGHSYLRYASAGLGLAAAAVLLALVLEVRAVGVEAQPRRPRLWAFVALVPATFVLQEHLERLFHDGSFPWTAPFEPAFLLGFAVQVPFALAAWLAARLLLRVARVLAALLGQPSAAHGPARARWSPRASSTPRAPHDLLALGPRGPPALPA
jgi:hypothetical protein